MPGNRGKIGIGDCKVDLASLFCNERLLSGLRDKCVYIWSKPTQYWYSLLSSLVSKAAPPSCIPLPRMPGFNTTAKERKVLGPYRARPSLMPTRPLGMHPPRRLWLSRKALQAGTKRELPHGGVRPFHQKLTCLTELTLGPDVVQIWPRNTPESGVNETLVLHPVEGDY